MQVTKSMESELQHVDQLNGILKCSDILFIVIGTRRLEYALIKAIKIWLVALAASLLQFVQLEWPRLLEAALSNIRPGLELDHGVSHFLKTRSDFFKNCLAQGASANLICPVGSVSTSKFG